MKILLFHPVPLPPRDYGGVERVVLWLARGLAEKGHDVTVAALEGSRLPPGVRLHAVSPDRRSAAELLKGLPPGLDVVHFMAPPEAEVLERLPCAGLLTVHGNGRPGERYPLNTVFLSADHARRHGATEYVHNGIDPAEYEFAPELKEDWFLFLSKTSWSVKNLGGAIRYCAKAGASLRVAGGNRPWGRRLEVWLRPGMRWLGPVSAAHKARVLTAARALVFPVCWPEPFGLVVAEALMSGTPVLASPRGSLPELLPPDVGALLQSEADWVKALGSESLPWKPERCRAWALEKFHYAVMTAAYERVYGRVADGKRLHESAPVAGNWREE